MERAKLAIYLSTTGARSARPTPTIMSPQNLSPPKVLLDIVIVIVIYLIHHIHILRMCMYIG